MSDEIKENTSHTEPENRPALSVVIPMFNESASAEKTVTELKHAFDKFADSWEVVFVDDGSSDDTREKIKGLTESDHHFRIVGYKNHIGRGKALRFGLTSARGEIVVTIDFDLSYSPEHIFRIYEHFKTSKRAEIVLGSCYSEGGSVEGVAGFRLITSKVANRLLSAAFGGKWKTVTCVLRGYRRKALDELKLTKDDKTIHLEILKQAAENRIRVEEIPAHLTSRKHGVSKTGIFKNTLTHLFFAARINPGLFIAFPSFIIALIFISGGFLISYICPKLVVFSYYFAILFGSIAALTIAAPFIIRKRS